MASSKQVLLLATVVAGVACLASLASATQFVIGGDQCEDIKRDFNQAYTNGKTFVVGDTLLFKYEQEKHKVAQVGSEDDFNTCNKDGNKLGEWCSGNDVVQLNSPGRWWFICAKGDHCSKGMKLAIDVVGAAPPPPWIGWPFPGTSPPPPSPPFGGWQPYPGLPPPPPPFYGWAPPFPVAAAPPPPSAAVRNAVGDAMAVAAATVVAAVAALAF